MVGSYNVLLAFEKERALGPPQPEGAQGRVNLGVFVFVVSAVVYVQQRTINPDIDDYLDALYFTIATLTTTGFGDITLEGKYGRLLATLVMIIGISLFRTWSAPCSGRARSTIACPRCALLEHDVDAVYCKACGQILRIPTPTTEAWHMTVTALYAGLLVAALLFLTYRVILHRRGRRVDLGDGGDRLLQRYLRGHGNFAEYVPLGLLLLLLLEQGGWPGSAGPSVGPGAPGRAARPCLVVLAPSCACPRAPPAWC